MSTMTVSFRAESTWTPSTAASRSAPTAAPRGRRGLAPQPFDLFLASIATCAGIYVKGFCDSRQIPTQGLGLEMRIERDPATHRVARLAIEIRCRPASRRPTVSRDPRADQCAVKKHIFAPPEFEIRTV